MALGTSIVSYYKLESSSVDAVASNNGSDTAMSYGTPGKIGNGAQFDGISGTFSIPIVLGTIGTINIWFKRGDTTTNQGSMFGSTKIGISDYIRISPLNSVSNSIQWIVQDDATSSAWTSDTNWHMATLAWDATSAWTGYLDGVLVTTGSGIKNPTNTSYNLRLGVNSDGTGIFPSTYYKGSVDELGYWTRRLSGTEIIQLYNSGTGTPYPFTPVLTTDPITNLSNTSITANGTVVNDSGSTITERGFVYATHTIPTVADSKSIVAGTLGAYNTSITGLTPLTTYYLRAYAINAQGTSYGNEVSFTPPTAPIRTIYKDISGVTGNNYAVRFTVGGTTGTLTVALGSTGNSTTLAAGSGVQTFFGTYGGLYGLIFTASATFNGYIDDVMYVYIVPSADYTLVDWTNTSFTTLIAISSSVVFRRIEDDQFNKFRIYRYLDLEFKDLDGYVTSTIRQEQNDLIATKTTTYLVGGTSGDVSPFVKKKLSFLSKSQALLIGLSNNNLNDTFAITKFYLSGSESPSKLFDPNKIISIG